MNPFYIRLQESSCHNCMRCVRACPTNAMTYIHSQPMIVEKECILCGRCYSVCPHDAKAVVSDLKTVRKWLEDGEEVIMSIAPSFVSVWPKFSSLAKILQKRGFSSLQETARGAAMVSRSYIELIEEGKMKNIITTCCPAVNSLIEKEYGELTNQMAPVVSPLIAHGRAIKKNHPHAKVVFLSPCIAKYREIRDPRFAGAVDACISMLELHRWLEETLEEDETADWEDFEGSIARLYPTPGGIISTLPQNPRYKYVAIDGIQRVKEVLEALRSGKLNGYFFELNSCTGSCMGGPLLSHFKHNEWLGQSVIRENVDISKKVNRGDLPVEMHTAWQDEHIFHPVHTEEEIEAQMKAMGKTSPMKIHDCGACGYETCRLKAIAVLDGKADPRICLPEAVSQARSVSGAVIENTPNGIVVLDQDLNIREMNPAARKMVGMGMINPTGLPLAAVFPDDALERLIRMTGLNTEYIRIDYENYHRLIDHAIVKITGEPYTILILMDRTEEVEKENRMRELREKTLEVTRQVIDDQMRSVQEIASLLGETTAKSKVALTNLKKTISEE